MAFVSARQSALWGTSLQAAPRPVAPSVQVRRVEAAQELEGRVVSTKMQKTIVVSVTRLVPHTKYHKRVRRTNKFYAHDEEETAKEGDFVRIVPTRPLSKTKRFILAQVLRESK